MQLAVPYCALLERDRLRMPLGNRERAFLSIGAHRAFSLCQSCS
jgi:hypothetical protein